MVIPITHSLKDDYECDHSAAWVSNQFYLLMIWGRGGGEMGRGAKRWRVGEGGGNTERFRYKTKIHRLDFTLVI